MPTIPYADQNWVDGSGGGTPTSAARLLVIEAGIKASHYMPSVRVFNNAVQSIPNGTLTAVTFNSERFDQASNGADTMHDTVTATSRLTCRYAGVYLVTGHLQFASSAAGTIRMLRVRLNGATDIGAAWNGPIASTAVGMTVTTIYSLAVNDYVELMAYQDSGGALNTAVAANFSPEFGMVRVA